VVVSPGVPINRHPIAAHAAKFDVPLIGDIELFAQARSELPPHKVVGITGTNGKSTTTALVHHILKTAGVPTLMGGNIGLPILGEEPLAAGGVYVLELSSYQLDLTKSLDCDVAVLTNVTPDHLDRYSSYAAYERSKARLFEMQSEQHWVVLDHAAPGVPSLTDIFDDGRAELRAKYYPYGASDEYVSGCVGPSLQGPHNLSNAMLALQAVWALGLDGDEHYSALRSFSGLPHRMERVAERSGVLFVNDSKATNPTSTAPALAAFPKVRWIVGGLAKTDELDACAPHFGHVRSAYTIGEAGPLFARILEPHMPVAECGVLDEAVRRAANDAEPGDTVLLSPACASFDQFRDYEARGKAFRAAVGALL
jgi:UDP-N-acetylmuramoylalanine--D-glutamate ligase